MNEQKNIIKSLITIILRQLILKIDDTAHSIFNLKSDYNRWSFIISSFWIINVN